MKDLLKIHEPHGHIPVLPQQTIDLLDLKEGMTVLDCTTGRGGHGSLILPHLGETGRYIGLDVDQVNVDYATERLKGVGGKFDVVKCNFISAKVALKGLGIEKVDRVIADLGFASNQMDDGERGFSFGKDGPLDMRLDHSNPVTAASLVASMSEVQLADVIFRFGEDRKSRVIAKKIVEKRRDRPIKTTGELASIVCEAVGAPKGGGGGKRIHPATRTFMALRIAVNAELDVLVALLNLIPQLLKPDGIAAVISFHSLEDRLVKQSFAKLKQEGVGKVLTKKPLIADDHEIRLNARSRSAKMRGLKILK